MGGGKPNKEWVQSVDIHHIMSWACKDKDTIRMKIRIQVFVKILCYMVCVFSMYKAMSSCFRIESLMIFTLSPNCHFMYLASLDLNITRRDPSFAC